MASALETDSSSAVRSSAADTHLGCKLIAECRAAVSAQTKEAGIVFVLDSRDSPLPLIETVWQSASTSGGSFSSLAVSQTELVFTRRQGVTTVDLRGPETSATIAHTPSDAEFFGITFPLGVYLPAFPPTALVDRHAALTSLDTSFWLGDAALPKPAPEDAELFVERLVRLGLLRVEPMVDVILNGELEGRPSTIRTVQRRFVQATGLSHRAVMSIDRARRALALLEAGVAIPDVIHDLKFADQPHLTKSLQRLVGRTPARVADEAWTHAPLTSRERTRSDRIPK